ncbi:hypothetical protein O7600_18510 [Micromonospora sp. WMMA1998]|uniref:hypothetical protein n=1 Tax=Micromonospora sp. WMMA1998 TaxID=3015167 RepID=UPI00248B144C|nr:hypothetical protein [Micromonospora sp. WMMA1998]WBC13148.1 hypothetical protein O7600_18510 [Micromonospora sp. WMMA1998]
MQDTPPSVPDFTQWPSFPFEGDLRVKQIDDPVAVEPPRRGEADRECTACNAPDEAYIWVGERWRVRAMDRPTGLPMVLILESRSHLDLGDLPNLLAAELGVMTVRLERAVRSLDGVARVHVNRWGDGSAHLHMWFLARPYGRLQLRGTFLSLWDSILPPISEEQWRENLAMVAAWLAEFGGRPLAEPPRIRWEAPSTLSPSPTSVAEEPEEESASVIEAADEIPESEAAEQTDEADAAEDLEMRSGHPADAADDEHAAGDPVGEASGSVKAGTAGSADSGGEPECEGGEPSAGSAVTDEDGRSSGNGGRAASARTAG